MKNSNKQFLTLTIIRKKAFRMFKQNKKVRKFNFDFSFKTNQMDIVSEYSPWVLLQNLSFYKTKNRWMITIKTASILAWYVSSSIN